MGLDKEVVRRYEKLLKRLIGRTNYPIVQSVYQYYQKHGKISPKQEALVNRIACDPFKPVVLINKPPPSKVKKISPLDYVLQKPKERQSNHDAFSSQVVARVEAEERGFKKPNG